MSFISGTQQHFEYSLHSFYTGESQSLFISEWAAWASGYYPGSGVQLNAQNHGTGASFSRILPLLMIINNRTMYSKGNIRNHTGHHSYGKSNIRAFRSGYHTYGKGSITTGSGIQTFLTTGHLSFYWNLSETGNADKVDSVSGLHLPAFTFTTGVVGLFGSGVRLNTAINEAGLSLSGSSSLAYNSGLTSGYSFWFWWRLASGATGTPETLAQLQFTDSSGFQENSLSLEVFPSAHTIKVTHFGDSPGTHFSVNPSFSFTTGGWHLLTAVWDKPNHKLKAYIDGTFVSGIADTTSSLSTNSGAFSVYNIAGVDTYLCDIDEMGICLRTALNDSQVSGLWNGGTGKTYPTITGVVPL